MSKSSAAKEILSEKEDLESGHDGIEDSVNSTSSQDRSRSKGSASSQFNSKEEQSESEKLQLAKKETLAVFRLRLLVFLVLLLAAAAVSVIVFFITNNSQTEECDSQYDGAALKVTEAFVNIAKVKFAAISSLGVALVSNGQDKTENWPFLTISNFQQRATSTRAQSNALSIQINPKVTIDQRDEWEKFVKSDESYYWIDEATDYQHRVGLFDFNPGLYGDRLARDGAWPIWYYGENQKHVTDMTSGPYMPTWQSSPLFNYGNDVNENLYHPTYGHSGMDWAIKNESVVISEFITASPGDMFSWDLLAAKIALMQSTAQGELVQYQGDPVGQVYFPIFDHFFDGRKTVAILIAWIHWASFFRAILPKSIKGVYFVLGNTCGGNYTYKINGPDVFPIGEGDLHDKAYDSWKVYADFADLDKIVDGTKLGLPLDHSFCQYHIHVYGSKEFESIYKTSLPVIMTCAVAIVFVFTAFMFLVYDRLVERRQKLVMLKAQQTTAIVASLFPENVRERLMEQAAKKVEGRDSFVPGNRRLKGYLNDNGAAEAVDNINSAPIADLFPHCTVMFADIAGFTAWSSTREPAQVFILLQTVYQAFDVIAKRRNVFKVETIGDSYVAVTGLPEPQPTHAVIMARFAHDCRIKFKALTSELESTLGPDTGDLDMRFGMHSGPVTAGVLLGDRARFQLFGDTVNTAARMESTGLRNKIQCSKTTFEALSIAGKQDWARLRQDKVHAKGKGELQTFWLNPKSRQSSGSGSVASSQMSNNDATSSADSETPKSTAAAAAVNPTKVAAKAKAKKAEHCQKQLRLVNWIVDMLMEPIRKHVAMRKPTGNNKAYKATFTPKEGQTVLDEVAKVIYLPRFDKKAFDAACDPSEVVIDPIVKEQLRDLVATIADHYHDNDFHNFEHACHVSMAVNKLLKRIEAPDIAFEKEQEGDAEAMIHNYTHGINSDPLTILAIVFSALIHDVDHRGISNPQLIIEQKELGEKYRGKSVAECNSFDIAWDLLMQDRFEDLRSTLFTSEEELKRFRQVIVNVVLATDIFDPELNGLRKDRWNLAFNKEGLSAEENNDLRATIVIEHIIQASDVSHTMQHWHIYRKWNKRLFREMYTAYKAGRMAKNPADFWYNGEIGFFDNYVIPLAKKLKDCRVFGVSSDECLNYATQNRDEWKQKGQELVAEVLDELEAEDLKSKLDKVEE